MDVVDPPSDFLGEQVGPVDVNLHILAACRVDVQHPAQVKAKLGFRRDAIRKLRDHLHKPLELPIAPAVRHAFEEAGEINETLSAVRSDSQRVTGLATRIGLSDERIAEITDLERADVLRLRRRAARRSIVGD